MNKQSDLTRRGFVAVNVAAAATVVIAPQTSAAGREIAPQSGATMAGATDHVAKAAPANWRNASAEQLEQFIGDRFRVSMQDGKGAVLKLVDVVRGKNGADWPKDLSRKESMIAVFDSPDKAMLVACGCANHQFRHSRLGTADLYTRLVPTRSGDHSIEVVLG